MPHRQTTNNSTLDFVCNICGSRNTLPSESFQREGGTCVSCSSTVRHRSIIYLLTKYLLGKPQVLERVPPMGFRGVGLSCSETYAKYLKKSFQFTNTFVDRRPCLDINNPPSYYKELDFLISADVFEHTLPPANLAFEGANQVLKESGLLVLTIPYALIEQSIEHYPGCLGYRQLDLEDGRTAVELRFGDGSTVVDENPVWHGGVGKTLEMRVYARSDLKRCLRDASFEVLEEFAYEEPSFGIVTTLGENWGLPIAARKVPRNLRKRLVGWVQSKLERRKANELPTRPAELQVRLLEGWHSVEGEAFRWTAKQFSMGVELPEPAQKFAMQFFLPDAAYSSGRVEISCSIDGRKAGSMTCASPGAKEFHGRFPFKAVSYRLDFTVRSWFQAPGDRRDLGICVPLRGPTQESSQPIAFRVW